MMVSFMRCCKKANLFFALLLACVVAIAAPHHILIKAADLKAVGDTYVLSADLEIALGETVEEAIDKGVPVSFLYEFELVKPRTLWFDKTVIKKSTKLTVRYHALSRQYLVTQGERQTSHEILSEAMIELVQLYDWPVFDAAAIDVNQPYRATLKMFLDERELPKAIQVDAIGSEAWSLASETFEWEPDGLRQ